MIYQLDFWLFTDWPEPADALDQIQDVSIHLVASRFGLHFAIRYGQFQLATDWVDDLQFDPDHAAYVPFHELMAGPSWEPCPSCSAGLSDLERLGRAARKVHQLLADR